MKKILVIALSCVSLLAGCNRPAAKHDTVVQTPEYRKISAQEAHEMIAASKDYILLDARTIAEYREKRIPGALLMPGNEINSRAEDELPNKNALILVYCGSGGRSAALARELVGMGYVNVYDFGGINSWPYETVSN